MNITRGKIVAPQRCVLYGQEGVGKSTIASKFPNPVFIDTEGSTKQLDVQRTPTPTSWAMLMSFVSDFRKNTMGFNTLVIDTGDWAERLCEQHICAVRQKDGIEEFGYGKGYVYLREEFAKLLDALSELLSVGMHVIIVCHASSRKFELPEEEGNFDKWELKLSKNVAPLIREWADLVLFAAYKTIVEVGENGKRKARGQTRVFRCEHNAVWDAKNRHGLPSEIPMEWEKIAHIFPQYGGATATTPAQKPSPTTAPSTAPAPVSEAPAATPAPVTAPGSTDTNDWAQTDAQKRLVELMNLNNFSLRQITLFVESHPVASTYFPSGTDVASYPDKFVNGFLIKNWEKIAQKISEGIEA